MSLFNWMWDLGQDSQINEQADKIDELTKRVEILEDWIRHLNSKMELTERKE